MILQRKILLSFILAFLLVFLSFGYALASEQDEDLFSGVCPKPENSIKLDDDPRDTFELEGVTATVTESTVAIAGASATVCVKASNWHRIVELNDGDSYQVDFENNGGNFPDISHVVISNIIPTVPDDPNKENDDPLTARDPSVDFEFSEWLDGTFECGDTSVTQTRIATTTTTTYKINDENEEVVDEVTSIQEVEERIRQLADDEQFDCPEPELPDNIRPDDGEEDSNLEDVTSPTEETITEEDITPLPVITLPEPEDIPTAGTGFEVEQEEVQIVEEEVEVEVLGVVFEADEEEASITYQDTQVLGVVYDELPRTGLQLIALLFLGLLLSIGSIPLIRKR